MLALAIYERRDDVSQRGQREVDLVGLLQPRSRRFCLGLALRTGQIDKIELSATDVGLFILAYIWNNTVNIEHPVT